jgi:pyruvate dehydrogenase E2 component (dihydrolipoamide acetyltransferase)
LAVAASKPTVVANEDGMIGVKKIMTVNLTCDHRLVYGAQAAEFLQVRVSTCAHAAASAEI